MGASQHDSAGRIRELGALVGEGREAEVFDYPPDAVIKLYRSEPTGTLGEAAILTAIAGHAGAPRLIGTVRHRGRTGLVLERLPGTSALAQISRRPWLVAHIADRLARAQLRVHEQAAPPGLPTARESLSNQIASADLPRNLRDFSLRKLDQLPDGDSLCHGDYHPANVLIHGSHAGVIDWIRATKGVPESDFARTLVILKWAEPPAEETIPTRLLISAGREVLASAFTRAYTRRAARALTQLRSWMSVNAAARVGDNLVSERPGLLGYLERSSLSSR